MVPMGDDGVWGKSHSKDSKKRFGGAADGVPSSMPLRFGRGIKYAS